MGSAAGIECNHHESDADGSGGQPAAQPDPAKHFATLQAWLALAGWVLQRTNPADGPVVYLASRWGHVAPQMSDLAAVEAFANRVGARR